MALPAGVEKFQGVLYVLAILLGLFLGSLWPSLAQPLATLLWPVLGGLLYVTFIQVPLVNMQAALADGRFMAAAVVGNFVLVPLLLWAVIGLMPDQPGVQLGILLVLLVPCTDWFITFTHLGGGDTHRAMAFAPLSLVLQLLLLPLYVAVILGQDQLLGLLQWELIMASGLLIGVPLALAFVTERWCRSSSRGNALVQHCQALPVPLLALVLFSIAASQVNLVTASFYLLGPLALIFCAYLLLAALLARLVATLLRLPATQGRVLAFSFGSRNSFVVLPLAIALPAGLELAIVVVVFQSLVELFGMLLYLWLIPRVLFPAATKGDARG
ncbi:MAG: arsenic resistance protein [Halomonadaceae bacterium]|nr:MAG: arsenic resistance protein [Halomonadaceae bacterium]